MSVLKVPMGMFIEKSKEESAKVWDGIKKSLDALTYCDPYNGRSFFAFVYLKQEMDGVQNRHAYIQIRTIRPQAVPDSGLFRIVPKEKRYELLYYLPAVEHFSAFKHGGALQDKTTASWIEAFEKDLLSDPTDHDFKETDLQAMISGCTFAKSKQEMDDALRKYDERYAKLKENS